MAIYPLVLPGWEDQSIWGTDPDLATGGEYWFAQLWRNESTSDAPDIWITPGPGRPALMSAGELLDAIVQATVIDRDRIDAAMAAGFTWVQQERAVPTTCMVCGQSLSTGQVRWWRVGQDESGAPLGACDGDCKAQAVANRE